jgi:phosphopantothenoylcysteine decarboxylase/phosphopantothenate--cysteine ligase
MFDAVRIYFEVCDCLIMAAAVSDYTVATRSDLKLKKNGHPLTLELVPTQDILQWAGDHKAQGSHARIVVGFALEDKDVRAHAESKLRRKHLDMVIANTPVAIGSSHSSLLIKTPESEWLELSHADKAANARLIIDQVESLLV